MTALDDASLWRLVQPLLLAMPRVSALLMVAPLLARQSMPGLARNAVALSFSLCVYPFVAAHMPDPSPGLLGMVGLVAKELLVGALIGYAIGMLIWALQAAGALVDFQAGLSNAMLFDPFGGHESGVFGTLMGVVAVALFVACGGLYVMLSLLFDSYALWPPAAFEPQLAEPLRQHGIDTGAAINESLLRLAAPAVLLLVLVEVGIGLVNRVVPQLNVFYFSMPIKAALAALMLALCLAYLLDFMRGGLASLPDALPQLGRALGLP